MKLKLLLLMAGIATIICAIYIAKDASIPQSTRQDEPFVEQQDTQTIGYENGKKIFDIRIQRIKKNKYGHLIKGEAILDGHVYNHNGNVLIRALSGDYAHVNTAMKSIIITSNIRAIIEPSTTTQSVRINGQEFRYNHNNKKARFHDQLTLSFSGISLNATECTYVNKSETIEFPRGFMLTTDQSQTSAPKGIMAIRESTIDASPNIRTVYRATPKKTDSSVIQTLLKNSTTITSDQLHINHKNEQKPKVLYTVNAMASQPGKIIKSDAIDLDFKKQLFRASANVELTFDSLDWVIQKRQPISNAMIRKMLKKTTLMLSDMAWYDQKKNHVILKENVTLKQAPFKLKCDELRYDITKKIIELKGNVKITNLGIPILNAQHVIIDIENEQLNITPSNTINEILIELTTGRATP